VKHFASPQFWRLYRQLPPELRDLADKNFQLLKADSKHPSLHSRKSGVSGQSASALTTER
jgi:hypothetical protein